MDRKGWVKLESGGQDHLEEQKGACKNQWVRMENVELPLLENRARVEVKDYG